MKKFVLKFSDVPRLELIEMEFTHPLIQSKLKSIRGKVAGSFKGWGTFQWTRAVQALALLSVNSSLYSKKYATPEVPFPSIEGRESSLALSLDYAIQKRTNWLLDIFGCDSAGLALARRLFLINNSGIKRPGPVVISFNASFLPLDAISVELNGIELNKHDALLSLVDRLSKLNCLSRIGSRRKDEIDPYQDPKTFPSSEAA